MIEIKGLTKVEISEVIQKVAKNHKNKRFGPYTEDDIEQEVWIIALNKLPEFVPERGKHKDLKQALENWLNTVISRRLANFYRDKHLVPQKLLKSDKNNSQTQKRKNLMNPLDIDDISDDCVRFQSQDILENECWQIILDNLNEEMLDALDALLSGQPIGSYYKNKLKNEIKSIIGEKWLKERN